MNFIKELKKVEQIVCPTSHVFSDGVYSRTITMPKGTFVVGKKHLTEHLNIISVGKAKVWMDGIIKTVEAPAIINSGKNCRKILLIEEDMLLTTIHVTNETDLDIIEKQIISNEEPKELENIIKELQCI